MIETIIGALLPVVVTLLLGFVAGWRQDFDSAHALILNRMSCSTPCRSRCSQEW